jgi:two-component system KDP operon response regulator KdpE
MSDDPAVAGALVLVVEDDPQLRRVLRAALLGARFRWIEAATGAEAIRRASEHVPDVVLLDLGLPDMDGVEVARAIRAWSRAAIIVLSARGHEREKVALLNAGADDYLTKPFGYEELVARIRAATRRLARVASDSCSGTFDCGPLRIEFAARRVTVDGEEVHLTPIEFKLLAALAARPGRIVGKAELLLEVWGPAGVDHANYLRVYMTHLRRKLHRAAPIFRTEAGVGYGLECGTGPGASPHARRLGNG